MIRSNFLCKQLDRIYSVNIFYNFCFSAITLRKIGKTTDEICQAIYSYNLSSLPLEYVEMLPRFVPNEIELKAFKDYERSGKSFDDLTAEDKFMWLVGNSWLLFLLYLPVFSIFILKAWY